MDKIHIEAQKISEKLRVLHTNFNRVLPYPNNRDIKSAIFDIKKKYIFGAFNPKDIFWDKESYVYQGCIFYILPLKPYYLGASYLIVSKKIDYKPIKDLETLLIIFLIVAFVFFFLLGLFLGKLFVAPMKESMESMDRFIQDTTHELNTPISTILSNIELLDTIYNCEAKEEMKRIEIASKTLSRLYDDLTYLKLNHKYHTKIEHINISQLLHERIEFFSTMIEAKYLVLDLGIEDDIFIDIDNNDAIRLIDNILSNAIKYNKKRGELKIILNSEIFTISNSGFGIQEQDLKIIYNRFSRANSNEGGFGIGLDIIQTIIKRYGFKFNITSKENIYTEAKLEWKR
jgi:two-component system OmpR family sensor kinase